MSAQTNNAPLSRRRILGRLSAAAVGGGALAATGITGSAHAADGDDLWLGHYNESSSLTAWTVTGGASGLSVSSFGDSAAIYTTSTHVGLWGRSFATPTVDSVLNPEHIGVLGTSEATCSHTERIGVRGLIVGGGGTGVEGISSPFGYGVRGWSGQGFGVRGDVSHASGIGVSGSGPGVGVKGEGQTGVLGVGTAGQTGVKGTTPGNGWGIWGTSETGHGVHGDATGGGPGGVGVFGRSQPQGHGVRGESAAGFGVFGQASTGIGVSGDASNNGWGVRGTAANGGWGVQGVSDTSFGVRGDSTSGAGVRGESQTSTGVYGRSVQHTGVTGYGGVFGVVGQCDAGGTAVDGSSTNGGTGVWGRSTPTGYGVRGESSSGFGLWGSAPNGTGVSGQGKLGGEFGGSRAAVRLVPTATVGSPTTGAHARGELVCDKNGGLWFCRTGGTPGTWVRIA